jgi:hypothetical protein
MFNNINHISFILPNYPTNQLTFSQKLLQIILKNSCPTLQNKHCISIIWTNCLLLLQKIITTYHENYIKRNKWATCAKNSVSLLKQVLHILSTILQGEGIFSVFTRYICKHIMICHSGQFCVLTDG